MQPALAAPERTEWLASELARPAAFPPGAGQPEVRRTLVSLLVFTRERVYKLKQALDLGFIDASTLERRRFLCEEEVRLNARLAPGVHLGVVPITLGPDGHLVLRGRGEVVEWAVEMVRLPEEGMLARRLELGVIDNEQMNALAALLVDFHRGARTGSGVDEFGSPACIRTNVEENFEQLAPFVRSTGAGPVTRIPVLTSAQHSFLRARARSFLAEQRGLLEARVTTGRIREGHGDLHAENVCILPERFVVYDRIEFSSRLRCLDVVNDLAFLVMDLDARGFPGFGAYMAHRYAELAGDTELPRLLGFYKAYRAIVRAKVAALSASNGDDERRAELRRASKRYLQLALGYELRPTLVLMAGLPGSGKSFLAAHLARQLRAALLHSDERRKRLAGMSADASAGAAWGQGLYTLQQREATYRSLLEDAVHALSSGRSVVADASFTRRAFRRPFVDAAVRLGVPYCFVHVSAPEEVVRARMSSRGPESGSDADFGIYLRERAAFEPLDEVPDGHALEVSSAEGEPEDGVSLLFDRLIELEGASRAAGARPGARENGP
jgi:aminoglycoside phosphotransferase family enzyme/predicted kinase